MRFITPAVLAIMVLLLANDAVFAQAPQTGGSTALFAQTLFDLKPIGAGLIIVGAALGIGGLGRAAVESMARQPELAGNIQTAMIIAAALIEGVTFFALLLQIMVRS
jgi:F-type H+-transporting ATPase subunit c